MAAKKKVTGTSASDVLNGTTGADVLAGLAGDDTYVVNHVDDEVVEKNNEGRDTVIASVSYVLPANVENLTLSGAALRAAATRSRMSSRATPQPTSSTRAPAMTW